MKALLSRETRQFSVGQRMSWASRRQTTRIEDTAYCLMGIFGVNMPLLYGEGGTAFLRLQLEIIKSSDDHTIFSWTGSRLYEQGGLLARHPAEFAKCGNNRQSHNAGCVSPYAMTNKGLRIELRLLSMGDYYLDSAALLCPIRQEIRKRSIISKSGSKQGIYLAFLNCQRGSDEHKLGIYLGEAGEAGKSKQEGDSGVLNSYIRIFPNIIEIVPADPNWRTKLTEVYVIEPDDDKLLGFHEPEWRSPYYIKKIVTADSGFAVVDAYPHMSWNGIGEGIHLTNSAFSCLSRALVFKNNVGDGFLVMLGFVDCYNPQMSTEVVTFKNTEIDWEESEDAISCLVSEVELKLEHRFKNTKSRRYHDRVHASLPGGFVVFVSLRPGRVSGENKTLVEITVKAETSRKPCSTIMSMHSSQQ
ncbi:hypothetical protein MMC17_007300 [Xylographa soralifera]|nr:hypothetical protein [Xylographa soralifera]